MESDLKNSLKTVLSLHEGPGQAVKARQLAGMFGYKDDRAIRLAIRELIAEGLPVASSTEKMPGYFLVTSRQQAELYAGSIKSRLIEDAKRRRDFRKAADMWLTPAEQGKLL